MSCRVSCGSGIPEQLEPRWGSWHRLLHLFCTCGILRPALVAQNSSSTHPSNAVTPAPPIYRMRSLQLHPSSECGHSSSTPLLTPAPHGSVRSGTRAVTVCDERCFVCVSLWCVYWGGGAWRHHHKYLRTMFRSARASSISTSCWTGENTATSFSVGDRLKSTPCISKPYAVIHTQDPCFDACT